MAASPQVDISSGFELTAATANVGWTPYIIDITPPPLEVDEIQTSYQGTTDTHTYMAAKIREPGEFTFDLFTKEDDVPVVGATNEEFTLTWPDTNTWVFSGFVKSYEPSTGTLNGRMTSSATIKVSGNITGGYTYSEPVYNAT